jgi:hypothetical protein
MLPKILKPNKYVEKEGGVAELKARSPMDPKVSSLNHRGPQNS